MHRGPRAFPFATAVCALTLACTAVASAQPSAPIQVRRAVTPPALDGVLDDELWQAEPVPAGTWVSYNPLRGEPARQATTVWMGYDDEALYFAFQCVDPEPDRIRTTITRRDNAWNDDWVALSLDSTGTGQVAYHMFVNPSGIQMDALNTGANGEDTAPDWIWQSAGKIDSAGYTVEIRLPLESIRFRGGPEVRMNVMFFRRNSRMGLSWSWPEMAPGQWVFETQVPVAFSNLRQRRLLEVIPSATLAADDTRALDRGWTGTRSRGDLGVSVKYGVTSTVTLDATVNPDFSQVESDAFQVEVNQRFPVFFSEKRPFFMEGLGLFNLAGTGGDASMRTAVHTRRIVDPSAGVKLTGTAGRQTFAVLSTADASPPGNRQKVFTIGRLTRNLGQGEYVGVLAAATEFGTEHNRAAGVDFVLRHGESFSWNGSLVHAGSRTPAGDARSGVGAQVSYSYGTRRVNVQGQVEHYGRGFQMDTAFLNRVGITRAWQYQEVQFYPDARYSWIRRIAPFFWVTRAEDRLQGGSELFALPGIRFNFTRQGNLRLDFGRGHETFAGRRFTTGRVNVNGGAQFTRWLNVGGWFSRGPGVYYDAFEPFGGTSISRGIDVGLQPNANLSHGFSYNFVTFARPGGERVFAVHVVNLRNTYQFTPRFLVRAIAQFDSARRRVLGDVLASYELSPGTVVHAGYGSLFDSLAPGQPYDASARAFFFKASYLARF